MTPLFSDNFETDEDCRIAVRLGVGLWNLCVLRSIDDKDPMISEYEANAISQLTDEPFNLWDVDAMNLLEEMSKRWRFAFGKCQRMIEQHRVRFKGDRIFVDVVSIDP